MRKDIICELAAREILDSRGNPTLKATVILENGITASASVPSGASTGSFEAVERRDSDKRYGGKGVKKAVKSVERDICAKVKGICAENIFAVDQAMISADATANKAKFGANAICGVSLAVCRAAAKNMNGALF